MKIVTRMFARIFLFLATCAFLTAAGLFVMGSFFITWPILKQSPRTARKRAIIDLGVALMALSQTFAQPEADVTTDKAPKST